jgi:dimethylargininase
LTSQSLGQPDLRLAQTQHQQYREALKMLGFELIVLEPDDHPDSCFVEDMAVVGSNDGEAPGFTLASHSPLRCQEQAAVVQALRLALPGFRSAKIEPPGRLEGGDVLRLGRSWFVGLSARTDRDGFEQFRAVVEESGDQAFSIEVNELLHLKTGVSRLDQTTVLALPALAQTFAGLGFRAITVSPKNWHAANVLAVGRRVLMPSGYGPVAAALRLHGYQPCEVDLSEFAKQDGGVSCLSILLP